MTVTGVKLQFEYVEYYEFDDFVQILSFYEYLYVTWQKKQQMTKEMWMKVENENVVSFQYFLEKISIVLKKETHI